MTENKTTEIRDTANASKETTQQEPVLIMQSNGTTFLIGLHFSETSKETLEDKIKKLIRKDVENGNF